MAALPAERYALEMLATDSLSYDGGARWRGAAAIGAEGGGRCISTGVPAPVSAPGAVTSAKDTWSGAAVGCRGLGGGGGGRRCCAGACTFFR
jgi:hypothetical protein